MLNFKNGGRLGNRNLIAIKPSHCLANKSRTYLVNLPLKMVHQEGFEPPTQALEVLCSIQLSYWCIMELNVRFELTTSSLQERRSTNWANPALKLAPEEGFEPSLLRLTVVCTTVMLLWNKKSEVSINLSTLSTHPSLSLLTAYGPQLELDKKQTICLTLAAYLSNFICPLLGFVCLEFNHLVSRIRPVDRIG